jgi:hypothetical protein
MRIAMFLRHAWLVFLVLGMSLLVVGGVCYLVETEPSGFAIEQPQREIPGLQAGMQTDLTFLLQNPTWHNVRIVGLVEC